MAETTKTTNFITTNELLEQWLGHRRLTRKTIEAFPEDKLFTYSVGGMRTFGEMAGEILGMARPTMAGLATGDWSSYQPVKPQTKAEVLRLWDEDMKALEEGFLKVPAEVFGKVCKAFGQWEMPGRALVLYVIDNEIHHRGQGFVYLRSLGVEPPAFWDRD